MSDPRGALDAVLDTVLEVAAVTGAGLATSGVHNTQPPQNTAPPYVVYVHESSTHRYTFDKREWQCVYAITAWIADIYPKKGSAIASAVDGLLSERPLTVAGFTHVRTEREGSISVPPRPDVPPSYGGGARYRITVDEAM
jgi:hypothetical protein